MGVFVCFFQKCFGIWLDFPTHSWLTSELVFVICRKIEKVLCVGVAAPHKKKKKKDPTMASFAEAPAGDVAKGTLSCLREGVRAIWLRGRARVADKISSLY